MRASQVPARRAPLATHRGHLLRQAALRPVLVELEDGVCDVRMRITEDQFSYGVMAQFGAPSTDAFEVELEGNQILITMALRDPQSAPSAAAATEHQWLHRDASQSQVSLTFPLAIDALASCGECADGLLHLSLRKETP